MNSVLTLRDCSFKTHHKLTPFQKLLKTSANPKTAKKKKKAAEKAVAGEAVPQLVEQ